MLEMKKQCEACEATLQESGDNAWICSFECTFCTTCAEGRLSKICPNCEGELVRRPRRDQSGSPARTPRSGQRYRH
jgi:hypothetical protein